MTIKDEVLSAYLDEELEPEEAARVRALVAGDASLADRLERLRLAGELLRESFAPLAAAPGPHAPRIATDGWARFTGLAMIATAACAAGIVLGVSVRGEGAGSMFTLDGGIIASPAVARALDGTASGAAAQSGGVKVAPLYSFRDSANRACRVFRVHASSVALEAAACRDRMAWSILALAPAQPLSEGFVQAEAAEPPAVAAAVDEAFGAEIDAEEEAALIAREWR